MEDEKVVKTVCMAMMEDSRGRRSPKLRWMDWVEGCCRTKMSKHRICENVHAGSRQMEEGNTF
jgi:hypothetical protein